MKAKIKSFFKSFFTKNIALKIVSLVLGLAIWIGLSNTQDPTIQRTVEVPVTYINADLLAAQEEKVMLDGPATVIINVTVRTSKQNKVSASLFKCTADLTDHTGGDLMNQRVHITVEQTGGNDIVLDWSYLRNDPNITVAMDNIIERTFKVELLQAGGLGQGLHIGTPTFTPAEVAVRGPESEFSSVNAVKALVDFGTVKSSDWYTNTVSVGIYDGNNNRIESGNLTYDPTSVEVKVFVFGESSVNLNVCYTSTVDESGNTSVKNPDWSEVLAEGYVFARYEVSPSSVNVHGSGAAGLNGSLPIPIQTVFDALRDEIRSGSREPVSDEWTFTLNLADYLPGGVTLSDWTQNEVTVTVRAEQKETRDLTMETDCVENEETGELTYFVTGNSYETADGVEKVEYQNPKEFTLTGASEDLIYRFEFGEVVIRARGLREKLDIYAHTETGLSADVTGLTAGEHEITFVPEGMTGVEIVNAESLLTVRLVITEKTEVPETETSEEGSETEPAEEGA